MAQCPTSHTLSQACHGSHHRDGETAPRLERLRPLLPSSFRKGLRRLLISGCCPAPTKPPQPRWVSFLPSFTSFDPPGPRSQSCSLTCFMSPTSISGYPFPSSLERIRLPVLCLPTTPLVRGCLFSPLKGQRALEGAPQG